MRHIFLAAIFCSASIAAYAQPSANKIVFTGSPDNTFVGTHV